MTSPQHFQLIDGTFTPAEARQILGAMVKSKIEFHSLEKHSDGELSGDARHTSEGRLKALRELDAQLRDFLGSVEASGKQVVVKGHIEISPAD